MKERSEIDIANPWNVSNKVQPLRWEIISHIHQTTNFHSLLIMYKYGKHYIKITWQEIKHNRFSLYNANAKSALYMLLIQTHTVIITIYIYI